MNPLLYSSLIALLLPIAAHASLVTYMDQVSFDAATTTTTVDFEGTSFVGLDDSFPNLWHTFSAGGFELGGATFTVPGGSHYQAIVAPAYYTPYYDRGTGTVLHADQGQSFNISFAAPTQAFAFDLSTIYRYSTGGTVTLTFSNGDVGSAALGDPFQFNGFTSSSVFTSVQISAVPGDYLLIDNVQFGSVSAAAEVPLPASLPLLLAGVAGLGVAARHRKTS